MGKPKKNGNKKAKAGTKVRAAARPVERLHPMVEAADIPAAQRARSTYAVAAVPNPYGEFLQNGVIKRHKVVRRVPAFETLYKCKVIDRAVFDALEWYDERLALAESGLFKSGLDNSGGGGGSAFHHIPTTEAAMEARSDVDWARGFIPASVLPAFDGVMSAGETFEQIGATLWPRLAARTSRRKASSAFMIAANYLYSGIGQKSGSGITGAQVDDPRLAA